MALLTQEASLRSPRIDFRRLDAQTMARLRMADGSSFDVYKDEHPLLRVQSMPAQFRAEVRDKLVAGQGHHVPVAPTQLSQMVYRLTRDVKIGDTIWMQSFKDDRFFRVFHYPVEIVDAIALPLGGRIPHQR